VSRSNPLSKEEALARRRESSAKYRATANGKAKRKAWRPGEASKAKRVAYDKSEGRKLQSRASRYNITVKRLQELLEAGCYAAGCNATGSGVNGLVIDHDHNCCKGGRSCGNCVRGALCSWHNKYLGFLEADWLFAIWAMRQPSLVIKVRREA